MVVGPHVCGDSIDVCGNLLLAGSYRNQRNLQMFDLRYPNKVLQYLEMDHNLSPATNYFCDCQVYTAQFYKQMKATGFNICAAGATGGKNEVRIFEDYEDEVYKPTFSICDFAGGV